VLLCGGLLCGELGRSSDSRLCASGWKDASERMLCVARLVEMHLQPAVPFSSLFAIIADMAVAWSYSHRICRAKTGGPIGIDHVYAGKLETRRFGVRTARVAEGRMSRAVESVTCSAVRRVSHWQVKSYQHLELCGETTANAGMRG
jgi:hypothetical protein